MIQKKTILTFVLVFILLNSSLVMAGIQVEKQNDEIKIISDELPTYRAVLIGIGESQGLPYSVNQLNGFKTTILRGSLFKQENIRTLFDEQATKEAIKNEIQWLANNSNEKDVSLFYFVGHGSKVTNNELIHASDNVIVDEELAVYVENITGSLIMIIDACYSGGFIEDLEMMNRTIISSCGSDEVAYQVHDLKSGMFGFFFNLSLSWYTKNIETSFLSAKILTKFYGKKLSNEHGEDYQVYPKISDNDPGLTWILFKHAYGKQLFSLIKKMIDEDGFNPLWRMD